MDCSPLSFRFVYYFNFLFLLIDLLSCKCPPHCVSLLALFFFFIRDMNCSTFSFCFIIFSIFGP
uniref:Uncharacterized protein n=1 Tax=Populus trichocarpa TaxID=3694 RepID=A0A2K1XM29_POPTR